MKKSRISRLLMVVAAGAMLFGMVGCGGNSDTSGGGGDRPITVIAREEGSGTRDAFTELTGVKKDDVDMTVDKAEISNSTSVVIQSVVGNEDAIGYISLGSLDDTVKALNIDGVEATVENIKGGDYKLQRAFNIVTKGTAAPLPQDFIDYIMSDEGQKIIEDMGYIASVEAPEKYESKGLSGTITVAGSTSVAPVMEVIADKYKEINKDVTIEIQQTGSGAGIQSTIEGVCDIGMASRELKPEESSQGISGSEIALDGIAVIANKNNSVSDISLDSLMKVFTGEIATWNEVQ